MNSGFTSITSTTYEYTRMVLHCDIKAGTQQDVRVLLRVLVHTATPSPIDINVASTRARLHRAHVLRGAQGVAGRRDTDVFASAVRRGGALIPEVVTDSRQCTLRSYPRWPLLSHRVWREADG